MKRLFLFLSLLLFTVLLHGNSLASNMQGMDLTYYCLDSCTVRMELRGYRSCDGVPGVGPGIVFTPMTPGCAPPTAIGPLSQVQIVEVTEVCPGAVSSCVNPSSSLNGVEEWYYFQDYDICSVPNCLYTLGWMTCCRTTNITNGQSSGTISINATTLNTGITPCNSSPQFSTVPVPYICAGQPYTFNQGATDPDGDSLSFSLGTCYASPNTPFAYNPGFTPQQPLGASWNIQLDPVTGDIQFTPQPGNLIVAVICIYVEEWRNGILLNTVVRDMQVNMVACTNIVPQISGITNVSGGQSTGPYSVTACAGSVLNFDLQVVDPDNGQTHTAFWNHNIPGLVFSLGSQIDTIVGPTPTLNVSWIPPAAGVYTFLVTAKDDGCPYPGTTQRTVVITIVGGLPGAAITATPIGCTNATLSVNPGPSTSGPLTYQWSGDGNINSNPGITGQTFTHTFPGPGTYGVSVLVTDGYGCSVVLNDSVTIQSGPTADAGPDISLCSGYPVSLGTTVPLPGQIYSWTPPTGLSNPNAPDPTLTNNLIGTSPVTLTYAVTATSGLCTAIDYMEVTVYPSPTASISGPTNICNGQSATLTASGGSSWLWSNGATTASITVGPGSTTTYSVVAIANGCASPPVQHTVNVSNGPAVVITGIDSVCPGGSVTLSALGGNSWLWDNGATTSTITLNNIVSPVTVSVTASSNGCPGPPATFTVELHEQPQAEFTHTAVCLGAETSLFDQSSIATGNIISWNWDFGDPASGQLNHSNSQSPSHQFSAAGNFNVELTVTAYNGCTNVIAHQVVVNSAPVAEFAAVDVCEGERMSFSDLSTANAGIVTWLWEFGNGATSNLQNPTYLFSSPGTHNVTLTVTDANGCTASRIRTVRVHPNPESDFEFSQHCFFAEAEFLATSSLNDPLGTAITQYQWNFGDPASGIENIATGSNPGHLWAGGPRTYNVSLTTISSRGCASTVIYPVVVPNIGSLEVLHDSICRGFSAHLQVGNMIAGTQIEWFYTPDATVPFITGQNSIDTPPLEFTTHYYVAIRGADGCLSSKSAVVAYVFPEANVSIEVSSREVDIPSAIVEFKITSIHNGPLSSLLLNFGDGATSSEMNPVHEFTQTGFYDISLSMVNVHGCISEQFWPQHIQVDKLVTVIIPNAFTPNGDGLNDVFTVSTRLIIDFDIQIYDRWGKLIFSSSNPAFAWTGLDVDGEPAPEGVYVYVVKAREWEGELINRAGSVTLIR